ncbi:hypothetical protein [Mucilaginibacter sp. KACC 22063]|uniref:hypothetical protein n=1 Tax=Mucilaginibacter sp. KACC 22063 TaxID=3025666 RepID=UPI0023663A9A|nr:hypothetical protein [Mucilaginibacter sp. KACC 22063]WDF56745.1 hypothetical protein PQ461_06725 [Mucilaginibacter sp. KACC 22063]
MKYAFLLGSNAFIVDQPVITYEENGNMVEILRIKSLYGAVHQSSDVHQLVVDTNLKDVDGHNIVLADNDLNHSDYKVVRTDKQIHVTNGTEHPVIDILQLDDAAIAGLSSHVINELGHVNVDYLIRVRGDFMVGEHHITIDNEKMFVDDDSIAESVHQIHGTGLQLGVHGVTF